MAKNTGFLPGLSPVAGKPVLAAFDGSRLTSDAGVLVLAEIDRRLGLIKVAGRVTEMATRIRLSLPSSFPYPDSLAMLAGRVAKLPP